MLKNFWRVFQSNVNKKDRQKFIRTYEWWIFFAICHS